MRCIRANLLAYAPKQANAPTVVKTNPITSAKKSPKSKPTIFMKFYKHFFKLFLKRSTRSREI